MTEKRAPIDLVGRAAARLELNSDPSPPGPEPEKITPWFREEKPDVVARTPTPPPPPAPEPPKAEMPAPEPAHEPAPVAAARIAAAAPVPEAPAPIVVDLDWNRLHKDGFITPGAKRSLIAEQFRVIKRPLLRAAFAGDGRPLRLGHVAMITSPRPGDGKTFTAINLGLSIASERDVRVLLIDCDTRRMGLSKALGLGDRKGLMDLLTDDKLSVADVLVRTNIPNLCVIPAGARFEGATELLASQRMAALSRDIASRYADRFVIYDAPPALVSSEPGALAAHVGQVVIVVNANETTKRALSETVNMVDGCPSISFVLNKVTLSAGGDRFGSSDDYYTQHAQA